MQPSLVFIVAEKWTCNWLKWKATFRINAKNASMNVPRGADMFCVPNRSLTIYLNAIPKKITVRNAVDLQIKIKNTNASDTSLIC